MMVATVAGAESIQRLFHRCFSIRQSSGPRSITLVVWLQVRQCGVVGVFGSRMAGPMSWAYKAGTPGEVFDRLMVSGARKSQKVALPKPLSASAMHSSET